MNPAPLALELIRLALELAVLAGVLAVLTRAWPSMPAGARAAGWWLLCLRAVAGLAPIPRFPVPLGGRALDVVHVVERPIRSLAGSPPAGSAAPAFAPALSPLEWAAWILLGLWIIGAGAAAFLMARRILAVRRQWRSAAPCDDPRVIAWRRDWALALGRRVPEVRIGSVTVPMTVGGRTPGVLLPQVCREWSDDTLRLVFAHELSHVRRGDALLGIVPALAELLFWFHPFVRFAAREYLAAREEVCDAEALSVTGAPPRDYGALLLQFGVGRLPLVPGSAACGALRGHHLKRRLVMLSRSFRITWLQRVAGGALVVAFAVLAFAPVRLVRAESQGAAASWGSGESSSSSHKSKSPIAYLILTRGEETTEGAVDQRDLDFIRGLTPAREDMVYFRLDSDMWISTDPQVRADVLDALEPQRRLEAEQAPLEQSRQALEHEQEKLEERSVALDARKAEIEQRRQSSVGERSTREQIALEDAIDDLRADRDRLMRDREALHERMSAIIRNEQRGFAEQDRVHQKCLGEIAQIARRAVRDGRAEPWQP